MGKNWFLKFCKYNEYVEELRDNCVESISKFIDDEWNPKLEYYVECEDTNILSIMVCDLEDEKSFEFFVINALCEKYDLHIAYFEIWVNKTNPKLSNYVEWGLELNKK